MNVRKISVLIIGTIGVILILSVCKSRHNIENNQVAGNLAGIALTSVGGKSGAVIREKMYAQERILSDSLAGKVKIETINRNESLKITFCSDSLFVSNSNTIQEPSKKSLQRLAVLLNEYPDTDILVIGHTDRTGLADFNRTLSEKRAESVGHYLTEQGVASERISCAGKGFQHPVSDNFSNEGRTSNRRLEIYIIAGEKMIQEARNVKR
ncbi:MAG: OmpA family protein [Tannerella sp.]|jgi:outer membrane protein OmpA-like peptidoglycan-associated protein|nr:OmpA family protein [Tannerella sp.]